MLPQSQITTINPDTTIQPPPLTVLAIDVWQWQYVGHRNTCAWRAYAHWEIADIGSSTGRWTASALAVLINDRCL